MWKDFLIYIKIVRCRQDSNLRGETPLDFKSNALTTRPRQLSWLLPIFSCNDLNELSVFCRFTFKDYLSWKKVQDTISGLALKLF